MLDCFTQSRAFPQTTPPSLCILHTLSTKQNTPLISSTTSRLKSPRGDFTKTPTPDSIRLSVTRVLTPIGYIALQFDSGGGAQQCFCLRLARLVSLPLVVCVLSRMSSEREGARAPVALLLVLFGCLSSNYGDPTERSSYREAPIGLSDPISLIVSRSVDHT